MSEQRLLRLPDVLARTGLHTSTIYKLINKKQFPRPVKVTEYASAWVESEIADWIAARISDRGSAF